MLLCYLDNEKMALTVSHMQDAFWYTLTSLVEVCKSLLRSFNLLLNLSVQGKSLHRLNTRSLK